MLTINIEISFQLKKHYSTNERNKNKISIKERRQQEGWFDKWMNTFKDINGYIYWTMFDTTAMVTAIVNSQRSRIILTWKRFHASFDQLLHWFDALLHFKSYLKFVFNWTISSSILTTDSIQFYEQNNHKSLLCQLVNAALTNIVRSNSTFSL